MIVHDFGMVRKELLRVIDVVLNVRLTVLSSSEVCSNTKGLAGTKNGCNFT